MNDLVEVRLVEVPVAVWQRANAHHEAVQREFDIMKMNLPENSIPHQLVDLIAEFDRRFGGIADPTWQDMYAAAERGDDTVTLVFRMPIETAAAAEQLEEMLDKVDDFCRAGEDLLTLATPRDLVSFRRWFLGEFKRQIDLGLPPVSWSEWEREIDPSLDSAEPAKVSSSGESPRPVRFDGDLDLATAGALRDEIMEARTAGAKEVTVDLGEVKFVDSVGLSLLVTAHNRLVEDGVEMKLVLPEKLRVLFEISGLLEVLQPEFVDQAGSAARTGESS